MTKDIQITVQAVYCDDCGEDVKSYNGCPYVEDNGRQYCSKCAYKRGIISKKEWCELNGIGLSDRAIEKMEISFDEG